MPGEEKTIRYSPGADSDASVEIRHLKETY